ncbi:MAG: hypothetical protein AAGC68_02775 [Verrucomicrobiota bacterium]
MKTVPILALAIVLLSPGLAQEGTIAEHPFFASLIGGSWTETGEVVLPQGATAGSSTSEATTVLGGQWIQQDGKATFGEASWEWRWMFRLATTPDGKEIVQARYMDTNGQVADYLGEFVADGNGLRLSRSLSETVRHVVMVTNQEDDGRLIEVAIVDAEGKANVQYRALGKKDR